jgi:hypothetical protein
MKNIRLIAWVSAGLAVIIFLIGIISFLGSIKILNVAHNISYIHAANSLLLISIALFIASKQCCCDKCKSEEKS